MGKSRVYIETTVISYLTSRPSRDVVIAGHQQSTHDWWATAPGNFELVISELVRQEAASGDPEAVRSRLTLLTSLTLLDATAEAQSLADKLVRANAVPEAALRDAAHIAIAAANGVEYLVTWNFRHIANAVTRPLIEFVCRQGGFESPVICSPEELMEGADDER